ncbi:MAG: WD40 repeat domain-containing serine/threonine-protein kinase [Verrucomicrobiaceae bacterium]
MSTPRTCPKCNAPLPVDAPEGLCPACLMAGGIATDATIKLTPSQKPSPASQPPAAPPPEELAPLFPQLDILELLGRGGMGAVYKARQPKLNRFVALKIIAGDAAADPHFAERFQREAQALAKLNHPNIVSVFDFGETGGLFYFLMEFVDGANLRTLMQSGEMKPEAALALIPAFCDALQYAHDEGVVHRDIKPENVLVDKKGRLKIADFGLAKLTGADAHDHTLTRTGMYLGTPRYMAPEQVEKPETVDHRADIYSLGVVFYEMLTGELPMGRFDPPSKKVHVDVKLDDIVLHALEKEPARRYQHASEVKTDVESVTSATPIQHDSSGHPITPATTDDELEPGWLVSYAFIGAVAATGASLLVKLVQTVDPGKFANASTEIWVVSFGVLLVIATRVYRRFFAPKSRSASEVVSKPLDHRVSEAVTVGLPGWFHGRARWVQIVIEAALLLVFIFGLVSLLGFQVSHNSEFTSGTKLLRNITTVRIGTPSPWLTAEFGGLKHGITLHWVASSLWIGLMGAAAAWVYEMLRRARPGFDVEADRRKQRKQWIIAAAVCGVTLALFITMFAIGARRMENSARGLTGHTDGPVTYLEGHTSAVKSVAVSADGRTLVSAGMDGRVLIRDLPDGKLRRTAVASSHPGSAPLERLRCAAILADNEHVLIGGDGGSNGLMKIHLFKNQIERLAVPNEFGASFTQLMPCDFGAKLAYITRGTELNLYDMGLKRLIAQPAIFPGKGFSNVHAIAVSPDGAFIAVPSSNMEPMPGGGAQSAEPCKLTIFDVKGAEWLSWQFADYPDFAHAQVVFTDTRMLAVCLPSGKMQRFKLEDDWKWHPLAETVRIKPGSYATSAVSRDGKIIWLAEGNQITGIDSTTGKGIAFIELKIGEKKENYSSFPIEQIAVTNEPLTIAAALWDGRVALAKCWSLENQLPKK